METTYFISKDPHLDLLPDYDPLGVSLPINYAVDLDGWRKCCTI